MKKILLVICSLILVQCSALGIKKSSDGLILETGAAPIDTAAYNEPVVLVSFQSVTCSFCKDFNRDLVEITDKYPRLPVVLVYPFADFREMVPPELKGADNKSLAIVMSEWAKQEPSLEKLAQLKTVAVGLTDDPTYKAWQADNTPTFIILKGKKRFLRREGYEKEALLADLKTAFTPSQASPSSH